MRKEGGQCTVERKGEKQCKKHDFVLSIESRGPQWWPKLLHQKLDQLLRLNCFIHSLPSSPFPLPLMPPLPAARVALRNVISGRVSRRRRDRGTKAEHTQKHLFGLSPPDPTPDFLVFPFLPSPQVSLSFLHPTYLPPPLLLLPPLPRIFLVPPSFLSPIFIPAYLLRYIFSDTLLIFFGLPLPLCVPRFLS